MPPQPDLNKRLRNAEQTSHLFGMPQEMRDNIYNYLLPHTLGAILVQATGKGTSRNHHVSADHPHPLSQVCRQLRREISKFVSGQSLTSANYVLFVAKDLNLSALECYLKLVNVKTGLADFKYQAAHPTSRRTLIVEVTLSKQWCKEPDTKSFCDWSKFVSKTASLLDGESLAEYHFKDVEDKKLAAEVVRGIAAGLEPGREWTEISNAFLRWYRYGGDEETEEWFMKQVKDLARLDRGEINRLEVDESDEGEDGGEAIWGDGDVERDADIESDSDAE